jgi:hypothetical protein
MAINVNSVYKTVLLILNKEQRGYMTPDEFNKTATKVQLDIFEQYFDDLNQQIRVPQADFDYSDRQIDIDDKISMFKCLGNSIYNVGATIPFFPLPSNDLLQGGKVIVYNDDPSSSQFAFYRLGTVTYNDVEIQRLQRNEFYNIDKSDLTEPSENFPVYFYESRKVYVKPVTIQSGVKMSFLRKPRNVIWNFTSTNGYYEFSPLGSLNFELETSEQTNVINRILLYAGVVVQDPTIISVAAQQIKQEEQNAKS